MKIEFSNEEYRALLDLIEIGEWVRTSFSLDQEDNESPYYKVEQKILAHAGDFKCADVVEYDKETKSYYPTAEFDEEGPYREIIENYDEETFWDELTSRLADRDFEAEKEKGKYDNLSLDEKFAVIRTLEEKYDNEFTKNGLENLKIAGPAKK